MAKERKAYLEPVRIHHIREYAAIVIGGFRLLQHDSWSAESLQLELQRREQHGDWRGFRKIVEANAEHLRLLDSAAGKLERERERPFQP